jgi:hypothetical protein
MFILLGEFPAPIWPLVLAQDYLQPIAFDAKLLWDRLPNKRTSTVNILPAREYYVVKETDKR